MSFNRRDFFKQLSLVAASLAILPGKGAVASAATFAQSAGVATAVKGTYKVLYTFTAQNQKDITDFLMLLKTSGVRSNNTKLEEDGHLLYRSEFYPIADGSMQSTLIFKSKESYQHFLNSSKSVDTQLVEFKKQKNISIKMEVA